MNPLYSIVLNNASSSEVISPDNIREELARILASPEFRASPRRREMLTYLVEEMLAGRGGELKGYNIGTSVFGRGPDFDAQSDPVVRIEARRLRRDLAGYYVSAGRADLLRISIPTGQYVPEVSRRGGDGLPPKGENNAPDSDLSENNSGSAAASIKQDDDRAGNRFRRIAAALLVIFALFSAALGYLYFERLPAGDNSESPAARGPALLVLPFNVHGDSASVPVLAAGISERLIADLNRSPTSDCMCQARIALKPRSPTWPGPHSRRQHRLF